MNTPDSSSPNIFPLVKNSTGRVALIVVLEDFAQSKLLEALHVLSEANPEIPMFSGLRKQAFTPQNCPRNLIPFNNINRYLGTGMSQLIIDMTSFNADYMLALIDALENNGKVLLLLGQNASLKLTYQNYFLKKAQLAHILIHNLSAPINAESLGHMALDFFASSKPLSSIVTKTKVTSPKLTNTFPRTEDLNNQQRSFINEAYSNLTSTQHETNQIFLLAGIRGTGKTTCAIRLAQKLLAKGLRLGLLNAGAPELSLKYKNQTANQLKALNLNAVQLSSLLVDVTLENYIQESQTLEVLFIEEAASLPFHKLKSLIKSFKKILLITTIEGYEGSGRKLAYALTNGEFEAPVKTFFLPECYRFNYQDQIGRFLRQAFFLSAPSQSLALEKNSSPTGDNALSVDINKQQAANKDLALGKHTAPLEFEFSVRPAASLLNAPQLLESLNQLLRANHYEQTIQDLLRWLDSPSVFSLATLKSDPLVVCGVAVATPEYITDRALAQGIYYGERRPAGNLFPQSLLAHSGLKHVTRAKWLRIERVAVASKMRRQKIGTKLISALTQYAHQHEHDFLCVAFALNPQIVAFWTENALAPLAVSLTPDNASGLNSCFMFKALNNKRRTTYLKNYATLIAKAHLPLDPQINSLSTFKEQSWCPNIEALKQMAPIKVNLTDPDLALKTTQICTKLCSELLVPFIKTKPTKDECDSPQELYLSSVKLLTLIQKHHIKPLIFALALHHHSVGHAIIEILLYYIYSLAKIQKKLTKNELSQCTELLGQTLVGTTITLNLLPNVQLNRQQQALIRSILGKLIFADHKGA